MSPKDSIILYTTYFFNACLTFFNFLKNLIKSKKNKLIIYFDSRKFLLKKYFYTINHKKLGLYYFYFSLWTGCSGALLATMIRLEMAYPGSPFFKGDSLRYLQVMTAHALIMIFFVVVPIFFGGFANFLLPYHVGSKDVAFPRLNSIGFWIQPCGYLLIAKIGFVRQQYWHYYDKSSFYFPMIDLSKFDNKSFYDLSAKKYVKINENTFTWFRKYKNFNSPEDRIIFNKLSNNVTLKWEERLVFIKQYLKKRDYLWEKKKDIDKHRVYSDEVVQNLTVSDPLVIVFNLTKNKYNSEGLAQFVTDFGKNKLLNETNKNIFIDYTDSFFLPLKLLFWKNIKNFPENFWYLGARASKIRRKKRFVAKCSSPTQTVAGWTFITPFSSNVKFTGFGVQDMLITGIYIAGISTTISLTNLLVTRRTLSMPGLRNRRILLPFTSITILLMLRALAIITPVLGSAMLMLLLDRHWKTSFFDFSYGGDPVLFHHLFWFFGHPEVYVLVIPAFGVINVILPYNNVRRVASKHHLIWAIYIMNYMGFLVWGHHMYLIGLDHRSRALYSTLTIMISLPATIKVVNWTFSLVNGALKVDAALYASISFIFFFLVAGFTGMWLSHVSLNISMHDTMYVVAHFHLMLSGAVVMSIFAGFYYYFFVFFNIKYSRTWAYLHLIYYTGGQWLTFLPLFWVSFSGLPRRLHDFPAIYTGWQSMATAGHLVTMTGVLFFYIMIYDSHKEKKITTPLNFMIPRVNKRVLYYFHKIAFFLNNKNKFDNLPSKYARIHIINNVSFNKEFEILYYKKKNKLIILSIIFLINLLIFFFFFFLIIVIMSLIITINIAILTLVERKTLSIIQRRVGPNQVGFRGRLQFIADAIKLLLKGITLPDLTNKKLFVITPMFSLFVCYTFWTNSIWGSNISISEIEYNVVYGSIMSILFSICIILVGIFSRNKYSILSAVRSCCLVLNLEIFLGFFFLFVIAYSESFSFSSIINLQNYNFYFVSALTPILPFIIVVFLLETNRAPFDLVEAESELIAGYTTELGGFFFALFYLGEYFHLFFFSLIISCLVLGGWN